MLGKTWVQEEVNPGLRREARMPRVRLTEPMVQAAKKPCELWDTDVPGLFLRGQARKKAWGIRYVLEGKDEGSPSTKPRHPLGAYPGLGLYDAREKARNVLRDLEAGRDPRVPVKEVPNRSF